MKTLKTLKLTTQRTMEELEIPDTLEALQEQVGGYIEVAYVSSGIIDADIDMFVNEEGKLLGLEPTIAVMQGNKVVEVICGPVLFAGHDSEGNTVSLTEEQIAYLNKTVFKAESALLMTGNTPYLVKFVEV